LATLQVTGTHTSHSSLLCQVLNVVYIRTRFSVKEAVYV
jgi:hypothetical protein